MPFGMKNSPATFQLLVNKVISGLDGVGAYSYDVIIYGDTWEEHLRLIRTFFDRISEFQLTVILNKSEFCHGTLTVLGHVVGHGQVELIFAKVQAINDFPVPSSKKQLMRLLCMAGYYRKFCSKFSSMSTPLIDLLKKNCKFVWNENCQNYFENIKAMLSNAPVLLAPTFCKPFKVAVDASDFGAGGVFLQEDENGVDHSVCYFSHRFNKHQKVYSTIEKECLSLQFFEVYVSSSSFPLALFTDHNPFNFLNKMKNKNQRLLRWSLPRQEYDLNLTHIKGRDNVIADALSRSELLLNLSILFVKYVLMCITLLDI